jgi:catechol 2,3-dioxygenase
MTLHPKGSHSMPEAAKYVPEVMFSHFGIYCTDIDRLEDFYMRVLGFAISDSGMAGGGIKMTFMTRRPREHHQFVLGGGRDINDPTTVNQVGFKAANLTELRRIHAMLKNEPEAHDAVVVDHGISWSLYFRDAENIRSVISVDTPWYVPQPACWPLDISKSDDEIMALTERQCRTTEGFTLRADWGAAKKKEYIADGRLTMETIPTGNDSPNFAAPAYKDRTLLEVRGDEAPRVAMSHVGFAVIDLPALTQFYTDVLGYSITGQGVMPPIGDEAERDYVYLSRDPSEHQQVVLCDGRAAKTPSSINQLSLRITSLDELRRMEATLNADVRVKNYRYTCHGNSFSIYFADPEGNVVELAVESVWYVPAPEGWLLDLSLENEALIADTERRVQEIPGFLMRADWKAKAREELISLGKLEAEGLVSDVA